MVSGNHCQRVIRFPKGQLRITGLWQTIAMKPSFKIEITLPWTPKNCFQNNNQLSNQKAGAAKRKQTSK